MKITQIRNATVIVQINDVYLLIDPMLAAKSALPPLRFFDGLRLRNPLLDLPVNTPELLDQVTHCLITHCQKGHFDHLDRAGKRWLREKQIPVICTPNDAQYLSRRGLNVVSLPSEHNQPQPLLGGTIQTIPCTHGEGVIGLFMAHGVGYYLRMPGQLSLYIAGDTVLSDTVKQFILNKQPDVCLVPAGDASFDFGPELIMGIDEVIELTQLAHGTVVANHMEALSHCPVSRKDLQLAAERAGVAERLKIPQDGQCIEFVAH